MAQIILNAHPGVTAGDISERCRLTGVSLAVFAKYADRLTCFARLWKDKGVKA